MNTLEELKEFSDKWIDRTRYHKTSLTECGKCGCKKLYDLGHGFREGTVSCSRCCAKHWKKWYTVAEWDKMIG